MESAEEAAAARAQVKIVDEKLEKNKEEEEKGRREDGFVIDVVDSSTINHNNVSRLQAQTRSIAPIQVAPPFQTPPMQGNISATTLNSRRYTNRISLCLFVIHLIVAATAISFFIYKAVQTLLDSSTSKSRKEKRFLRFWLPPIEGSSILSIFLAFTWQFLLRVFPTPFMINFILWSTFLVTLASGVLLLCFAMPAASGLGIALVLFSIGVALYSCWVSTRIHFTAKVLSKSLLPVLKFRDLNGPAYLVMGVGFLYITVWCFAVIGAQNFYYPPLTILGLILSLAWTVEVMRNVINLTVSRVISLYYLRGMQSSTRFCFQRAMSYNLGSASLGSFFVPTIEAARIIARGLNLLEEEDEFMFSCAHCCLRFMEFIFRYGNSWAFVHIAAYGRGFVEASKTTWTLFERQKMEELVDSDMTSSVCFLCGVCSGAFCVIFSASWTYATHKHYTATVSLLAFFVGYLMTRIAMALPNACVACYYVCYAENPGIRLYDSTIPDELNLIRSDRNVMVATPRFPNRRTT